MSDIITLDPQDVLNIPKEDLPLMVFSDNMTSFFAWGIRSHQRGCYNHFMWMIEPNKFISQDLIFREVPAEKYIQGRHRLKFIRGKNWTPSDKIFIYKKLKSILDKPLWKRLYDPLQIFGIFIHCPWIQIPGSSRICSDYGYILEKITPEYNLKHPSPTQINKWTKARKNKYEVYLRYIPD